MPLFVQFGAGNIGRSFIGKLFAAAGYQVVFVDVDDRIVQLLNSRGRYPVVVKSSDREDQTHWVEGVRAVNGKDRQAVIEVLRDADCVATSVGQRALTAVIPLLAEAIKLRQAESRDPLDIIIAENLRSGAAFFRQELEWQFLPGSGWESSVGLVETSIGKMVPLMPQAALAQDPLQLFTEPYDTLIVDRSGFRNRVPTLPGLKAVTNIAAYVDRKLFMHNMSHAAAAYLGWKHDHTLTHLWQVMSVPQVAEGVRAALDQAVGTLTTFYPEVFPRRDLDDHAQDLLQRYQNRALGDTLHRVGRDLGRKLSRDDRLIGLCRLAAENRLPYHAVARAVGAALSFAAPDEEGNVFPPDRAFLEEVKSHGGRSTLSRVAGLDPLRECEAAILGACVAGSA